MAPPSKRRKLEAVETVTFDPAARQEYLTGFHKRKQLRIQNAREATAKREKEDRVRERKQLREQRKEELERHVAQVNAELRKQNPDLSEEETDVPDEGRGVESEGDVERDGENLNVPPGGTDEEEYVDEDKYTTVTVEAMDPVNESGDEAASVARQQSATTEQGNGDVKKTMKKRPRALEGSRPKKKFRYESKAERQATRWKQKSKSRAAKARREGN